MTGTVQNVQTAQRALGLVSDGIYGPKTALALRRAVEAGRVTIAAAPMVIIKTPEAGDDIPDAGRAKLDDVHPVLAAIISAASARCDVPFTVIEGLRSPERQRELVARGASKTTNSRHLTGHAVDLWPLDPATRRPVPSDAAFPRGSAKARAASERLWRELRIIAGAVKAVAREQGVDIEWGGDWGWDAPHVQLPRDDFPA